MGLLYGTGLQGGATVLKGAKGSGLYKEEDKLKEQTRHIRTDV